MPSALQGPGPRARTHATVAPSTLHAVKPAPGATEDGAARNVGEERRDIHYDAVDDEGADDADDEDAAQRKRQREINDHMRLLLEAMSPDQMDRYRRVVRTRIEPRDMKKFLESIGYAAPFSPPPR